MREKNKIYRVHVYSQFQFISVADIPAPDTCGGIKYD